MKKKFEKFTAIVTILLILAGAFDFFIESKYSDYSRRLDQFNTEIGNKMVYNCPLPYSFAFFNRFGLYRFFLERRCAWILEIGRASCRERV